MVTSAHRTCNPTTRLLLSQPPSPALLPMITSLQNPLVKRIVRLRQRRHRTAEGVFLIEGEKELTHALTAGLTLETIVYCPSILPANQHLNSTTALEDASPRPGVTPPQLIEVSPQVYAKLAYRASVTGLIALAHIPTLTLPQLQLPPNPLLLIVDGVEKPGNLGALLRTADGAGIHAVIVCDPQLDLYNPNVVRASLGALFTVPTVTAPADDTRTYLNTQSINLIVTTPSATQTYTEIDYRPPTALVLGSEKQGLPPPWLQPPAQPVRIPMAGALDSLNLSCSGAIIIYEALRQRQS